MAANALGFAGPLTRADRPLWAAAHTLTDLCELTAQWLEGRIESQPGYYGPVDVDEDDAPGLTATLITLNRVGFLTSNSQAGFDGVGYDGAHWQQRAAVTGFATPETLNWLYSVVDIPFYVLDHPCRRNLRRPGRGVPVTYREGRTFTEFGRQLGPAVIADELYGGCGKDAIGAVCRARQVTVYEAGFGTNRIWPMLHAAAERQGGAS